MKTVLIGFLFVCVTLSAVKGLPTFDAETIDPRRSNRTDATDDEVKVVDESRNEGGVAELGNQCQLCWNRGADTCEINYWTVNDNEDIEFTIKCMKGDKKLLKESLTIPNRFQALNMNFSF